MPTVTRLRSVNCLTKEWQISICFKHALQNRNHTFILDSRRLYKTWQNASKRPTVKSIDAINVFSHFLFRLGLCVAAWSQCQKSVFAEIGFGLSWTLAPVCDAQRRCSLVRWHVALYGSNSTWLDSTRLDSTRSTLSSQSSQSSKSRRACRARRALLFQHGGRRTILYKFSRFYALAYTDPICFIK